MNFNGFKNVFYKKFKIEEHSKKPVEGKSVFKFEDLPTWQEAWAIVLPEDIVLVDVDDKESADILVEILKETNTRCYVSRSQSGRGVHCYFKTPTILKNDNKAKSYRFSVPVGLRSVDFKWGFKNFKATGIMGNLSVEFKNGKWNEWIEGFQPVDNNGEFVLSSTNVDELPFWLYPLKSSTDELVRLKDGDCRNNALFRLKNILAGLKYTEEQTSYIFNLINCFVFDEPLTGNELAALSRYDEQQFRSLNCNWFDEKGRLLHHILGDYMLQLLHIYKDPNGQTWYYNGQIFTNNKEFLLYELTEIEKTLKKQQKEEVCEYVRIRGSSKESTIQPKFYSKYVAIKDGLLDFKERDPECRLMGFNPSIFVTNQYDVEYNPEAYDEYVDKFLDHLFVDEGDKEQRMIFEEYLGYTLFSKDNFAKKMLVCWGPPNTGKSAMHDMVKNFLGIQNYSTLKLHQINDSNDKCLVQLVNKRANFDDDASSNIIKGSAMSYLKTIINDKAQLNINPKFEKPFVSDIDIKMWVNTNQVIPTQEPGEEWMTRLLILWVGKQFSGTNQEEKAYLFTPSAKSYLLRLALEGYQRLCDNKSKFTRSAKSEETTKRYRLENDSVFRFFERSNYDIKTHLHEQP
ncbi:MAG: hypothetical protein HUJ52_03460, partial [Malacoplasma sp.]|nr:hypothetical protein [Malacoplasma sp.]